MSMIRNIRIFLIILFSFTNISAQEASFKYGKVTNLVCSLETKTLCGTGVECQTFGIGDGVPYKETSVTVTEVLGFDGLPYEDKDYLPFKEKQYTLTFNSVVSDLLDLKGNVIEDTVEEVDLSSVAGVDVKANITASLNIVLGTLTETVQGIGKDKEMRFVDKYKCQAKKSLLD